MCNNKCGWCVLCKYQGQSLIDEQVLRDAGKSNPLPTDPGIRCDIRKFRNEHRLSLRDVANATGLAIANIHRVERGGDIQLTTARILSRFFGRDIDELWPQD